MRHLFIFCVFSLLFFSESMGQNAFYRARKIINWRDSILILNNQNSLSPADAAKRKRLFLDSINSVVFYYAGQGSWDKFQTYPVMKTLYDTLFQLTTGIEDVRLLVKNSQNGIADSIKTTIANIDLARQKLISTTDALANNEKGMNTITTLRNDSTSNDQLTSDSLMTANKIVAIKQNITNIQLEIDSLAKQYRELIGRNSFKNFVARTATPEQKRLMSTYSENKVDISGFGYSNAVKMSVEKVTQSALFNNREALPPLKNFSFPLQSEIIDALAIYLAKRVKQEMVLSFTDALKRNLKTDSLLGAFFPETRKLFMSLPDDEFARFGTAWRYAISKDFIQLPDNFMQYNKTKTWLGVESYPYFNDAYQIGVLIRKKYNFIEMIEELNTRSLDGSLRDTLKTKALRQFVQFTNVINKELFSADASGLYWLDGESWNNMTQEEFEVFWALVNERYPKLTQLISFKNGDSKYEVGEQTSNSLKNWIKRILFALNKFQRDQKELYEQMQKSDDTKENPWEFRIATYWDNVEDIIHMVIDNQMVNAQYKKTIDKTMTVVDGLFNVYESIQRKNYVSAVDETLALIQQFVKNPQSLQPAKWQMLLDSNLVRINQKSFTAYLDEEYPPLKFNGKSMMPSAFLLQAINTPETLGNVPEKAAYTFNRYLKETGEQNELLQGIEFNENGLMLTADNVMYNQFYKNNLVANLAVARKAAAIFQDIILANGSKELSMVIEKYAMPVGSYKIKRRSRWSVDLNAYFGVYGGYEWAQSAGSNSYKASTGGVLGLTAPVGFTYSWAGYTKNLNRSEGYSLSASKGIRRFKGTSHSISITVIDIAAVVSYRFTNSADKPLPASVTWGQVIAPGLFYRYGIKNTPLCIHFGGQFAPQLRTIDGAIHQNTIRATTGVTMDLPLINLGKGK